MSEKSSAAYTERSLLDLLWQKHTPRHGNGPRWAMAEHVRDQAGFNASRTLDAIVMDTWPSTGLALHGFEIKCSRSDWKRELAQPWKADAFTRRLDYFWVVAPSGVVQRDELPERWGLMEPHKHGLSLRTVVKARKLDPDPLDRSFVAALLRAACHRAPKEADLAAA